jgi:hypothetical protein
MTHKNFAKIDDKLVPLYRVLWISETPHFCGEESCQAEGRYEIRLEQSESVWASRDERDSTLDAVSRWQDSLGGA